MLTFVTTILTLSDNLAVTTKTRRLEDARTMRSQKTCEHCSSRALRVFVPSWSRRGISIAHETFSRERCPSISERKNSEVPMRKDIRRRRDAHVRTNGV